MFFSELIAQMSCWKVSNIYSSKGREKLSHPSDREDIYDIETI